jgi:hypothetical protein
VSPAPAWNDMSARTALFEKPVCPDAAAYLAWIDEHFGETLKQPTAEDLKFVKLCISEEFYDRSTRHHERHEREVCLLEAWQQRMAALLAKERVLRPPQRSRASETPPQPRLQPIQGILLGVPDE